MLAYALDMRATITLKQNSESSGYNKIYKVKAPVN